MVETGRFLALAVLSALSMWASPASAGHVYSGVDLRNGQETSIVRDAADKKATVLIFVSMKCPCSISHIDEIKKLSNDFPEFRFLGVNSNTDEPVETARNFFSAQGFSFPILKDEKATLADEMKALKTPHAFVLSNDGKRLFQGGVSNSAMFPRADRRYLREALEDIKAGREVRTPLARALGCAIPHGG